MPIDFAFHRSLGQHFLCDKQLIDRIKRIVGPKDSDHFIEIGPGMGALTHVFYPLVASWLAIEKDKRLQCYWQKIQDDRLAFLWQDCCLVNIHDLCLRYNQGVRIIGNLPYNIGSKIIFKLIHEGQGIKDMHFMLQKEVVQRATAKPMGKIYGRLSVMVQTYCHASMVLKVPPQAFVPQPQVDSAVLHLVPKHSPAPQDPDVHARIVAMSFQKRRKKMSSIFKTYGDFQHIIDVQCRPEQLTVEDFIALSNFASNQRWFSDTKTRR